MNEDARANLQDATSMLDSVIWTLEGQPNLSDVLAVVKSVQARVDTALAIG